MPPPTLADTPPALREAITQLMASPPVQGILLVGSRTRGYDDGLSDYDLEVIVDDAFDATLDPRDHIALIWDGQPFQSRLIGDILTESRASFEAKRRSDLDVDHWPYEAAGLWYDRDGELAPLVATLAAFPEALWQPRLQLHYFDFWYHVARALKSTRRARPSTLNRALLLHRAAAAYLQCVFVLNRRWPPLPHWAEQALNHSDLALRPLDDVALLTEALATLDAAPLQRLHDALDPLLDAQGLTWHHDRLDLLLHIFSPAFRAARERWLRP